MKDKNINSKWKYTIRLATCLNLLIIIYLMYLVLKYNLDNSSLKTFSVPRQYYYLISMFIFTFGILLLKMFKELSIYIIIIICGILVAILTNFYSPIDESTHFYYIIYLVKYHKIPTLKTAIDSGILASITEYNVPGGYLNEAFQPPLYYAIGAIIYMLTPGSLKIKFFALRFFGVFCILVSIYFTLKTYKFLVNRKVIKQNDFLVHALILLFTLTPGFLLRMITVSNEHLIVPLASIFTYLLIVFYYEDTLKSKVNIFILSALTAALFLTKIYGGVVGATVVVILLIKKYYRSIFYYVIGAGVIVSPWFMFNLLVYGHLTSNQATNELVSQMTNASKINIDIAFIMERLNVFFGTFWHPQEFYSAIGEFNMMNTGFLNVTLILAILFSVYYLVARIREIKSDENILVFITSSQVTLAILFIIFGSMFNHADAFIGRYIFFTYTALIILLYWVISKVLNKGVVNLAALTFVFIVIFLFTNFFAFTLSQRSRDFFAINKMTRKIVDVGLSPFSNDKYLIVGKQSNFSQYIYSDMNNLSGFRLFLSSNGKELKNSYYFVLKDETEGQIIRKAQINVGEIKADAFYGVEFNSIKDSKNKTYSFSIITEENEENPLKIKLSQPNVYNQGKLIIDNKNQSENTVFKLVYSK